MIIDKEDYTTQTALIEACRSRTNSLQNINASPQLLPAEQQDFWHALFAFNQSTERKKTELPAPFAGFGYRQNTEKSFRVEAQLGAMDTQGTFLSLSWHHAVRCAFGKADRSPEQLLSDIKWGLRRAIKEQITTARRERLQSHGLILCEATNVWCVPADIHLDHHPLSFDAIASEFLDCIQADFHVHLTYDAIYHTHVDDPLHCRFKDKRIDQAWQVWHRERARLRAVRAHVNLSKPR